MENRELMNDIADKEEAEDVQLHGFSAEYEERKRNILLGMQDVENSRKKRRGMVKYPVSGRLVRVAVILLCGIILVPISIQAAVNVYRFTVKWDGHTASGTIEMDGDEGVFEVEESSRDDGEDKEQDYYDKWGEPERLEQSDGTVRCIYPNAEYVKVDFGYLPDGMIKVEEGKYDVPERNGDNGISIAASRWDGGSYDVINRGIADARTMNAGEYEYLLFQRGGVDATFDREVYIPVKEHSIIITMYVGNLITDDELTNIIKGMKIEESIGADIKGDVGEWIAVDYRIYDDSDAASDADEAEERCIFQNVDDEFDRDGFTMKVGDMQIYDNTCGISVQDLVYHYGSIDERLVDAGGVFREVRCRRLNEKSGDTFSSWGDYNTSSLRMVTVDVAYRNTGGELSADEVSADEVSFNLARGKRSGAYGMDSAKTTNFFYPDEESGADRSRAMTFGSPAYAAEDGERTECIDGGIVLNNDGNEHNLTLYFLVDESELADLNIVISSDGYKSGDVEYTVVYLGQGE